MKRGSQLVVLSHALVITRDDSAGCPVLGVCGELDLATSRQLTRTLAAIAEQRTPAPLVVDLTAVRFLSAAAWSALVIVAGTASGRGQAIAVVADEGQALIRSFCASGLNPQPELFDTIDAALHAVA
jgi:anti-anti-sigma factor